MRLIPAPEHGDKVGVRVSNDAVGTVVVNEDNTPVSYYPTSEGWQVSVLWANGTFEADVPVHRALDRWLPNTERSKE